MQTRFLALLAIPAIVVMAGALGAVPAQAQDTVVIAPSAPPPPQAETVPPAPSGGETVTYWEPGHWTWTTSGWVWSSGMYVKRPQPTASWVPGQWEQKTGGGYVWREGHWQIS